MEAAEGGVGPQAGLTAGQAARRLGVAVTTLRSWHQRYGLGPTRHTHGRHRRYGADDLARLETMRTLTAQGMPAAEAAQLAASGLVAPVPAPPAAGPVDEAAAPARAVRGLLDAATRLDHERVRELVARSLVQTGVVRTWEELVCPALVRIGERHAATGAIVEVEHLVSGTVSEALTGVRVAGAQAVGGSVQVLLACADEEQHTLALEALAAAAAEHGVACRLLGARVPPAALHAAVRRTGPVLLVLWSHAPATGDPEQLRALRDAVTRAPLLAAAGPGWPAELPEGVVRPGTLAEAVQLVVAAGRAGWHPG